MERSQIAFPLGLVVSLSGGVPFCSLFHECSDEELEEAMLARLGFSSSGAPSGAKGSSRGGRRGRGRGKTDIRSLLGRGVRK